MKQIKQIAATIFFVGLLISACKDRLDDLQPQTNKIRPVADAGVDQIINLPADSIELRGSGKDSDGSIVRFSWKKIFGPSSFKIVNPDSAVTKLENLEPGVYEFELAVTDNDGLTAIATTKIFIYADCSSQQIDFDISFNSNYSFIKKYNDPWDDPNGYYDLTSIEGKGIFQSFGEFNINVYQFADTSALSDSIVFNYFTISKADVNNFGVTGNCSINFKKLIREGGGPFNGSFTVNDGSAAQRCSVKVLTNLPPLSVTGSLNVAAQTITMSIKGKIYF